MSNNSKLLVPMYMEALVLINDKKDCLDLSPRLPTPHALKGDSVDNILGYGMQPEINPKAELEKGIHLHWTLPKELKHAFVDDGEEVDFPFVPNKWLVTRIQTNRNIEDLPSRLWIVESDSKTGDLEKNNLVIITEGLDGGLKNQQFEFLNVGKVSTLKSGQNNEFVLDSPATPILKAVGPGNPHFASFYPGCRNVFGFHDDMADLINTNCTLTYIVTGWYSDPSADPLDPLHFDVNRATHQQKKRKRELDWFRKQWKYEGTNYPSSTLLHSSIHSIKWDGQVPHAEPEGAVKVFTANTSMEALSTQISINLGQAMPSRFSKNQPGIEELLNALQFELLEDELNSPSLAAIKNEIHKRGFKPKNGGIFWEVARVETNDQQLEEEKERRMPFPNDLDLLNNLKSLNVGQTKLNKINLEIASLQQEYYFLWYKKAYETTSNVTAKHFNYEASRKLIMDEIHSRKELAKAIEAQVKNTKNKVSSHKDLSGPKPEFELKQKPEDRFWEPNEPVLLLTGTGVGNTDKLDFAAGNKATNCRTVDMVVKQLPLTVSYPGGENPATILPTRFPVPNIAVPNIDTLENQNIPVLEVRALTYETLLLDQSLANEIAWLAYKAADLALDKSKDDDAVKAYGKKVEILQEEIIAGNNKTLQFETGIQPPASYAITKWKQSWSPLFMAWEVEYSLDTLGKDNKDLLENKTSWILEDGLFFKNQRFTTSNWTSGIQGFSALSNAVLANLNRLLPDEIVNVYGKQNQVAQSLSGLHKSFLMQRADIQLPPLKYEPDPNNIISSNYFIDQDELGQIGSGGYRLGSAPGDAAGGDPNLFYPLRSGLMQVVNLSLVDVFGQAKKVIVDDTHNNVTYPASVKGVATKAGIIPLPPRILQPSRLLFHWLNAKDEVIYQDTGRLDIPVLGWILPNYLDNSLMIYDGDGNDVAILQVTTDLSQKAGLITTPFPGMAEIPDLTNNRHLEDFLKELKTGSIASALLDLALEVNLNITGTNAVQINTGSLLCGQPIALARCSVGLELMGLPAYNQRWDESGKQNSGGIEALEVPLRIGDYNKEKDGLLGYFQNDDYKSLYTTANLLDTRDDGTSKTFKSEPFFKTNLPVKVSVYSGPVKITLLLDPSAGVHISSGILPTKFVELFHNSSKEMLSSLDVSFMVAPFIGEKPEPGSTKTIDEKRGPGIPLPVSINANWKWIQKTDVDVWQKDTGIPEGKNKQGSSFKKLQVYEGWLKLSNLKK
jgi:hypothetical protein